MNGLILIILFGGGYGAYRFYTLHKKKEIIAAMVQRYNQKIREQLELKESDWYRIVAYEKIDDTLYHVQVEVSRFDGGVARVETIAFTLLFTI